MIKLFLHDTRRFDTGSFEQLEAALVDNLQNSCFSTFLIFHYLVWVFRRSNCAKFKIVVPYRNLHTKLFKVLQQIVTMQ